MALYYQKWHNGTSSKARSTETADGLAAIQAQLNNLGREIKKVNEKVYDAQVRCELCKGPHYTKDRPLKKEENTLKDAYYTQQTLEESLTKFMAESAKRHEENSNIIKEIRASTDAAIRNQGASIKTLEIQIGQMSKVLQERGIGGLPDSIEPNPRDHVKSISTAKADSSEMRYMKCSPYVVSGSQHRSIFSETVPFPRRLQNYRCDDWREAQDPFVDLGASVSVMPFSTYTNLGLEILSHTRLTIELADRTIKQPRGIAENVLVRIGKFIFPIDFTILDIPEDDDGPLILDTPLELETNQDVDFEPTIVNGPDNVKTSSKYGYKMKFSCTIGYKLVNADFIPSLSDNLITQSFYYSLIKDNDIMKGRVQPKL
ncbi:hypothetical protein Tco_0654915 [Tanacetum coccineum]|uniref:Uncharacterized protein n=1 Tax=Tanacetum coccineum TaxID=301880 RepID=A0ABQ4X4J3_9ASTR